MGTFLTPQRIWNLSKFVMLRKIAGNYPAKLPYYPSTVALEVTTKCNLACPRCERQSVSNSTLGHGMTMETFEKIAPIFRYAKSVSLVGLGEPFLNPDFWQIHAAVKNAGAEVAYFTNGLLLTSERIERTFMERTDYLFLDLDSLNPKIYREIKKGADLGRTIELIREILKMRRKLRRRYPKLYVNCAIQKDTLDEMQDIVKFAAREGIDKIWFTGVMTHIPETVPVSLFKVRPEKISRVFKSTKRLASKLGVKIRLPEITSFKKHCICEEPWAVMHTFYNGDVCACCHFRNPKKYYFYVEDGKLYEETIDYPDLIMGNVHEESVLDIWNNDKYTNLRGQLKTGSYRLPCSKCYYAYGWH